MTVLWVVGRIFLAASVAVQTMDAVVWPNSVMAIGAGVVAFGLTLAATDRQR